MKYCITLLITVENEIASSSWTPEVRLHFFYLSLLRAEVLVIVINLHYQVVITVIDCINV